MRLQSRSHTKVSLIAEIATDRRLRAAHSTGCAAFVSRAGTGLEVQVGASEDARCTSRDCLLWTSNYDNGIILSMSARTGYFGKAFADVRPLSAFAKATARLAPMRSSGGQYMFLRNEPTDFGGDFLCISFATIYLRRLQGRFAGGFVLENEPTGEVFSRGIHGKMGSFEGLMGSYLARLRRLLEWVSVRTVAVVDN